MIMNMVDCTYDRNQGSEYRSDRNLCVDCYRTPNNSFKSSRGQFSLFIILSLPGPGAEISAVSNFFQLWWEIECQWKPY